MSSYINFYLKSNGNEYIPLGGFSRNHPVYEVGNDYVPYGEARPLSKSIINCIIDDIESMLKANKDAMKALKKKKKDFLGANNSVEEKTEVINYIYDALYERKNTKVEYEMALDFYKMLALLINEADDTKYNTRECHKYDPENLIYAGVECGWPE